MFLKLKYLSGLFYAIKSFVNELKKLPNFELPKALFCVEHTGIYNNHLLVYLHKKQANICLEAATQIKNSLGNIRGKNDKVDAIRIAEYALKNRKELRLWQPKREVIQKLAQLAATPTRLISVHKILKTAVKENNGFIKKSIASQQEKLCERTLNSSKADLEKVEKRMADVIESDDELKRLFGLITSVNGIGKVTATQILITTNEFKDRAKNESFLSQMGADD